MLPIGVVHDVSNSILMEKSIGVQIFGKENRDENDLKRDIIVIA